jgi:hypothetical protein
LKSEVGGKGSEKDGYEVSAGDMEVPGGKELGMVVGVLVS